MRLYKRNYSIALRLGVSGYEEVLLYLVKKKITYLGFNIHYNDSKGDNLDDTSIFITEGDSASGAITKSRNPNLQAVFSLRGKPLNSFGLTKKIVYENEEFNLLQDPLFFVVPHHLHEYD